MSQRPPRPGLPGQIFTHARTVCHTYTHIHFQPHVLDEITLTMSLTRHGCLSLDDDDEYDPTPGRPGMTGGSFASVETDDVGCCTYGRQLATSYPYC
jgi:hypothetical protein